MAATRILRAMFVEGLDPGRTPAPFPPREDLDAGVAAVRRDHNFVTRTSIDEVAAAFWPAVDERRVASVLARIGPSAVAYWSGSRSPQPFTGPAKSR